MSNNGPYLKVLKFEVVNDPGTECVLGMVVHHGQVFNLRFSAKQLRELATALEREEKRQ
jgi:hypothetical protein